MLSRRFHLELWLFLKLHAICYCWFLLTDSRGHERSHEDVCVKGNVTNVRWIHYTSLKFSSKGELHVDDEIYHRWIFNQSWNFILIRYKPENFQFTIRQPRELKSVMEKIVDSNKSSLTFNVLNVLIVILTLVAYAYWKTTRSRLHRLSEKIPGPKGWPFIGSALDLLGTPHGKALNLRISSSDRFLSAYRNLQKCLNKTNRQRCV